jgi:hypothetical protein
MNNCAARILLAAQREGAGGVEEFGDGFFRARFGVDAQERLCAAGAQQQPGFGGLGLGGGFGVVEEELHAVEIFLRVNGHAGEDGVAGLESMGAGDDGVLLRLRQVEVDAAVLVLAVFGLEIGNKLAQRFLFLSHDVGEHEAVEQAVALGQVALEADAAGLLAAHDDFALEHEVDDILEADTMLDKLAAPGQPLY